MNVSGLLDDPAVRGRYRAYGIELRCDFPLPSGVPTPGPAGAARTIEARAQPPEAVESAWSGAGDLVHESVVGGGARLRIERGREGDHLVRYGAHAFHLSPDLAVLTCAPPAEPDPGWEHAMLDWVAYAAAVLSGMRCIHAGAVRLEAGVLAVAAASGGGKTTLAVELVAGGAEFFCDDVLAIELRGGRAIGHPGAPFACLPGRRRDLAGRLGPTQLALGDEVWARVNRRARTPAPVAAVVFLDRREDGPPSPSIGAASFIELRSLAVGFPVPGDSEARRFSALAALADQATLLRLEASPSVPAEALAETILARLRAEGIR